MPSSMKTEEEALRTLCCVPEVGVRRHASECMAWRRMWRRTIKPTHGYCGRAGRPEDIDEGGSK